MNMHTALWQREPLAVVRLYFEDGDAAMGIELAHLQEVQCNTTQAGGLWVWNLMPHPYLWIMIIMTSKLRLVGAARAWTPGQQEWQQNFRMSHGTFMGFHAKLATLLQCQDTGLWYPMSNELCIALVIWSSSLTG